MDSTQAANSVCTLSPPLRGEGGERHGASRVRGCLHHEKRPSPGPCCARATLSPLRGARAQTEFAACAVSTYADALSVFCISAACPSPAAPSLAPTQNDSGPLKDFARTREHTRCCGPAGGVLERRDGRWELVILL